MKIKIQTPSLPASPPPLLKFLVIGFLSHFAFGVKIKRFSDGFTVVRIGYTD